MMQTRMIQESMGYIPGMFSGRKRTGSLDGIRMTEEEIREWHRATGEIGGNTIHKAIIANQKTMIMPSVPMSPPLDDEQLTDHILIPPPLYIDQEGRACLKIIDLMSHTLELIDHAVKRFHDLTDHYPTEIIPCPSRYMALRFKRFYPLQGGSIAIVTDFGITIDYDVLVRGRYQNC